MITTLKNIKKITLKKYTLRERILAKNLRIHTATQPLRCCFEK